MHIINAFLSFTSLGYKRLTECIGTSSSSILPSSSNNDDTTTTEESPLLGFAEHHYEDFDHSMSAFQVCLYHGLCYYSLAILGYSFVVEHWSIVDSVYFATVVFTTIGYGDMSPTSVNGKLFTMFMSLYGIVILGIFLGVAGEMVVEVHNTAAERRQKQARTKVVAKIGSAVARRETGDRTEGEDDDGMVDTTEKEKSLMQEINSILLLELPIVVVLLIVGVTVGYSEGWTLLDSVWWLVVSGSTVGFGDYHPSHPLTRVFCVFFLPFLVAVLGELLARIASAYMDRKRRENEKAFLSRSMALSDLSVMDANSDGKVGQAEFLSYMLVALQKVSREDVKEIMELFQKLDVDGNEQLTKDDLVKQGWEDAVLSSFRNLDVEM